MTNKEKYEVFCKKTYIPIYSQSWWMDAICGENNWDVWIYEDNGNMLAAMPYYIEKRGDYTYITKAPLTQNNGIIFNHNANARGSSRASLEEKIINKACDFISSLGLDVYEQQYQTSFTNWSPFYWNGYELILRYSYIFTVDNLKDLDAIWDGIDNRKRANINKGLRSGEIHTGLDPHLFFDQVKKTYEKKGCACPFNEELWLRLYNATMEHNAGYIVYSIDSKNRILSAEFLVWDDRTMYSLIIGGDVRLQHYEAKSALDWYAIRDAACRGLNFDFEGSMIKRVAQSCRKYGATPMPYYRIRKVFNPEVLKNEQQDKMNQLLIEIRE